MKNRIFREGLLLTLFTATVSAAPIITATKDDNTAPGVRKLPGDNISYTITIGNTGPDAATGVAFTDPDPANTSFVSVQSTVIARNDAYSAIGNVQISIPAPGLLANDNDPDGVGPALTVTAVNTAGTQGSVAFNADGSFTFNPALGFNGATTFTYTMSDGEGNTDTATATITVTGTIWFINAAAGAGGDGRLTTPFNSVAAFNSTAADVAGDNIFLYSGTYTTSPTLLNNERLIGQGATASITTITGLAVPSGSVVLPATGGARPTIAVSSGTGITLASGNTINGLNVTNSNGSGITGSAVGTLTLADFDVTVTGGTALSLTTSGTVTASGADNDLNSTNGTALNIANVNIGAGNLIFKSISSGAGANVGINLNTTGSSGGLTVTGSGTAGSGGTIAGKTGADGSTTSGIGIFLNSTSNVSLSRMQLNNFDNFAIRGTSVTNFSLIDSVVNGTHGVGAVAANDEGALSFSNLLGSSAITRSTVANTASGGGAEAVVRIVNTSGTLDRLTIDNSTIANSNAVPGTGDDGMYFESQNSAVMKLTISNSHFTASRADLIQTNALNNSTMDIVVTGTEFKNNNAAILSGGGGTLFSGGGTGSTATVTFNISGNTFRDSRGHALGVFKGTGTSNFSGTISNNTVGVTGVANSGTLDSAADISVESLGSGTMTVLISGNNLRQYNEEGIKLFANTGNSVLNATVIGNTVTEPAAFAFGGIYAGVGGVAGDTARINLLLGSFGTPANQNSLDDGNVVTTDVYLENQGALTTFNLSRGGSVAGTVTGVVQDDNVGNPTVGDIGTINLVAGNPPMPLLFAPGGVERAVPDVDSAQTTPTETLPNVAPANANAFEPLTQDKLDAIVLAAMTRWESANLTREQLATLRAVKFEVANLPGWYLGEASGNRIRVDVDAGGNGWFYGPAVEDDKQFPNEASPTRRYANPTDAPASRIDLLTVILHEMGHSLGLEDSYLQQDRDSLMYGFLTLGERRLPAKDQALGAIPHTEDHPHFLGAPLNIGDLPPGKSVTITYVVTITGTTTSITNQGTVSGGNFANVLTDDPTVGGAANPTVTPVELPPTVTNVSKSADEDVITAFAAADFTPGSYSDPNSDALATVRITSLPTNGVLKISGVPIAAVPQDIAIGSIGTLTYTSNLNYNGPDSFGWNGSDGSLFALAGATVNVTVNSLNDNPTAGPDTIFRYPSQSVKVPIATLLSNDSDIDGGTAAFVSVNSPSPNGGTVTSDATTVYYAPAPGFTAADTFTYSINDGQGGTATGTVTVALIGDNAAGMNVVKMETLGDGSKRITFAGIPGRTYRVQSSDTLSTGPWTDRLSVPADAQGRFQFTDPPPLPPTRFYRSVQP